jgi:anti-sigma factor RsiW
MSDCTNLEIRDLLPDLARGTLSGQTLVAAEQHLATCASCRAELALVQRTRQLLGAAPSVDTSRIAAAVIASARRPVPSISAPSRRAWLLAASVAVIAAAAALVASLARSPGSSQLPPVVMEMPDSVEPRDSVINPTPAAPTHAELVVGSGLSELGDADLESLLRTLDGLDTQIDVEPAPLLPLLEGEV